MVSLIIQNLPQLVQYEDVTFEMVITQQREGGQGLVFAYVLTTVKPGTTHYREFAKSDPGFGRWLNPFQGKRSSRTLYEVKGIQTEMDMRRAFGTIFAFLLYAGILPEGTKIQTGSLKRNQFNTNKHEKASSKV